MSPININLKKNQIMKMTSSNNNLRKNPNHLLRLLNFLEINKRLSLNLKLD